MGCGNRGLRRRHSIYGRADVTAAAILILAAAVFHVADKLREAAQIIAEAIKEKKP